MVLNNYIELLTSPAKFFRKMERVKTYFDPWLFFVIFSLFEVIISLPIALLSLVGSSGEDAIANALSITLSFVLIPIIPFMSAGIAHLGLLILGHHDFYKTFKPLTYALTISAPYSVAQTLLGGLAIMAGISWIGMDEAALSDAAGIIFAIPAILLGIAATVHTVYTACVGASYTHRISKLRAFLGMYVIPIAFVMLFVAIPLLILMMFLFGAAIMSMPLS